MFALKNYSPLAEGRKEVISTTRILQGVIYPTYPFLRNTPGAPGEKNLKTPTIRAQEIKIITKTTPDV
jgi:hypothetical protein